MPILSLPILPHSTSGNTTLPSACNPFSNTAMKVLGIPKADPFKVCGNRVPLPSLGRYRVLFLRA